MAACWGFESFPTNEAGYRSLTDWLVGSGPVVRVGVEGTGSYGVGLARCLYNEGIVVVEVDRPDRRARRKLGKSDPVDAEAAARAAQSGTAKVTPNRRDGTVEQMRVLMIARRSARRQRNQTLNQLRQIVSTGPDEIRARFRDRYKTGLVSMAMWPNNGETDPRPALGSPYLTIPPVRPNGLVVDPSVLSHDPWFTARRPDLGDGPGTV
jgi:transposase